ncbi:MAG TPA: hypothetical protein VMU29_00230 [Smithella sp.]|nr:hypothetical protein [Smithella sp.]
MTIKNEKPFSQGWAKVNKTAIHIGMSPRSVRKLLRQGLPYSRLPSGAILISLDQADEYIKKFQVVNNELDSVVNDVIKSTK